MQGTLYVVATPIGNLDDCSPRAVRALSEAALIAAEDTRTSRVLLSRFDIRTPMASCHKFNEAARLDYFMDVLDGGGDVALISDAGTPCLSDPGHRLVARAAAEGYPVVGIPGPCAAVTAVSVSGFDAASFLFVGFLPRTKAAAAEKLAALSASVSPLLVFYESPRRIAATLTWLAEQYPQSRLCLCNDLTKKFERIYRGSPAQVLAALADNPHAEKGEYTGVVDTNRHTTVGEPAAEDSALSDSSPGKDDVLSPEARLADCMAKTGCTLKEAVQSVAAADKCSKKEIYAASLRLKAWFTTDV